MIIKVFRIGACQPHLSECQSKTLEKEKDGEEGEDAEEEAENG